MFGSKAIKSAYNVRYLVYVALELRDHPQPSWVLLPVQTQQGCGLSLVNPLFLAGFSVFHTWTCNLAARLYCFFLLFLDRLLGLFERTRSVQVAYQPKQPVSAKHWFCQTNVHTLVTFQARISIKINWFWFSLFTRQSNFSFIWFSQIWINLDLNFYNLQKIRSQFKTCSKVKDLVQRNFKLSSEGWSELKR